MTCLQNKLIKIGHLMKNNLWKKEKGERRK